MANLVNFKMLFSDLSKVGLVEKPISEYSKQEIVYLVQSCINSIRLVDENALNQDDAPF